MFFSTSPQPLRPTGIVLAAGAVLLTGTAYRPGTAIAQATPAVTVAQTNVISTSSIQQQTLYLSPDQAHSYNLEVEQGVTINGLYIPPGAEIQGQYVPAEGGLRYEASSVIVNGRSYPLYGNSPVLTDIKDPRDTTTGAIAEDAGIGAAGGLVLGELLGDAGLGEILGGAAAGAATGNITADRVVVVEPNETINLYR
jgi:hypothetical protein